MIVLPAITDRPVRLGVLISGGGTTLLNLLHCIENESLNAEVSLVISGRPDCAGVERSEAAGLLTQVVSRSDYESTATFSEVVFDRLRDRKADLVILAGFLSLLRIPADFTHRVLNIHPSLIPAFSGKGCYGRHVHEAVVARGVRISGCTVHFADNEYDHGPIILQRSVELPVPCSADTVASLVFEEEKRAYPEAIRRVVSGRLAVDGSRTWME